MWLDRHAKALSCRLTCWTGKAPVPTHPKHLAHADPHEGWYLPYMRGVVLDVGCGQGIHAVRVAKQGTFVVGIDRDMGALRRAERHPNVLYVCGDVGTLPVRDCACEGALVLDVLEHVFGAGSLLREVQRVLCRPGRIALSVPNRETPRKRRLMRRGLDGRSDPTHVREYTLISLDYALAQAASDLVAGPWPIVRDSWRGWMDLIGGVSLRAYRWVLRREYEAATMENTTGWRLVCTSR